MFLGFTTCLFLVATQHLLLGLFVHYCSPVDLSCGLFLPIIIKSLESDTLSPSGILRARAGHGTIEMVGECVLGEGALPAEGHRSKSPPSGISLS